MIRPGGRLFTTRQLAAALAIYSIGAGIVLRDLASVGIVQHSIMGVLLIALAFMLWRSDAESVTWLAAGVAVRGVLALGEAGAYVLQWQQPGHGLVAALVGPAGAFLSASSSFDMGAEWLVVLGSRAGGVRARAPGARELASPAPARPGDLRRLADRDPLTGAINRRALRDIFNDVQASGAMLLFFDLDGFKQINDCMAMRPATTASDCLPTR